MGKVIVITDSSAVFPQDLVERYQVPILPLTVQWDGKSYYDNVDIHPTEFYERLSKSETIPTTSQVTVGQFLEVFQPIIERGDDIIYLGISSGISATIDSAIQAKAMLNDPANLVIVDTQLVAMALSLLVLEVCRAVEKGANLQEAEAVAHAVYPRIGVYFTVNTLEYLHKGGRINSAKRLLGSMLNLKPIMEIREGKIELVESVISRKKAVNRILDLVAEAVDGKEKVTIAPFHALCEDEALAMEADAKARFRVDESIISVISPVLGTHVGPGTLAIAYMWE